MISISQLRLLAENKNSYIRIFVLLTAWHLCKQNQNSKTAGPKTETNTQQTKLDNSRFIDQAIQ